MFKISRLLWVFAAILSMVFTVLIFLPASWLALLVEKQTMGRISLGDAQGSFWRGSAFIGGAPNGNAPLTPLLPGRFTWRISPSIILGQLDINLDNPTSLSQAIKLEGNLGQWSVSGSSLIVPPERLEGLGAPLNTIGPSGQLRLSWNSLQFIRQGVKLDIIGAMRLEMNEMASRLSPIKPLGSYLLTMDWKGSTANITLTSIKGPMLLSGAGNLHDGHMQFSGRAMAEAGQEDRLANLLNLLGQRRRDGNKDVIALEFK